MPRHGRYRGPAVSRSYLGSRNLTGAASLRELIATMTSNEAIAKAVATHQGLTIKQIEKDGLYIETLKSVAGFKG